MTLGISFNYRFICCSYWKFERNTTRKYQSLMTFLRTFDTFQSYWGSAVSTRRDIWEFYSSLYVTHDPMCPHTTMCPNTGDKYGRVGTRSDIWECDVSDSRTRLWKSSPIATIGLGIRWMDPSVCCENAFHTGSKYEVSGTMLPRTDYVRKWHSSSLLCVTSTVPFCLRWHLVSRQLKKTIFFPNWLGHCHTSPGDVHRVLGEDDIRFLFC